MIILNLIITAIIGIFGGFWISYFKRKGDNLANKEDIAEITRQVEEIKSDLSIHSQKMLKNYEIELQAVKLISGFLIEIDKVTGRLSTRSYLKSMNKEDQLDEIKNLYRSLTGFTPKFNEFKIFLESKIVTRVDLLIGQIFIIYTKLNQFHTLEPENYDLSSSAFNNMREEIPRYITDINNDLETILGRGRNQ